jgi:hypothetical protein
MSKRTFASRMLDGRRRCAYIGVRCFGTDIPPTSTDTLGHARARRARGGSYGDEPMNILNARSVMVSAHRLGPIATFRNGASVVNVRLDGDLIDRLLIALRQVRTDQCSSVRQGA